MDADEAIARCAAGLPGLSIHRRLGAGAFGTVFAATDAAGRSVAVKILAEGAVDERARARFAEVAAIEHPNLLRLHALAEHEGRPYIVMEHVEGVELLSAVRPERAPIDPSRVRATIPLAFGQPVQEGSVSAFLAIHREGLARLWPALSGLASALDMLHRAGKVHRDVRPENVLLAGERVVLIDYGLLSSVEESRDASEIAGAPAYMAPDDASTPAADWYSFGVLLFEALTGALPFAGTAHEVIVRKRTVAAPSPGFVVELPEEARALDELCVKLLRRVPALRPTGAEILALLGS